MRFIRLAMLCGLLLTGCSSFEGELSRKYTEAARKLGINAVYPPREEFQIGDIYLVSSKPNDPDSAVSIWLGTADEFRLRANAFLDSRVGFQGTAVTSNDTTSANARPLLAQEDMFEPGVTTRDQHRIVSLPITGFPSIKMQAATTASTGLVGAMASLGLGVSTQTTVSLDFNDVRTYRVPQVLVTQEDIFRILTEYGGEKLDLGARELPLRIAAKEFLEGKRWTGDRCLQLAIVTDVYLTREIAYTYYDREIAAAGMKFAEKQNTLAQVNGAPAISTVVLQTNSTDPENTAAIAEALRAATTPTNTGASGGSFSFVSWNSLGLTFRQTYQRPVAIGWYGIQFDADPVGIANHRNCHLDGGTRILTGG